MSVDANERERERSGARMKPSDVANEHLVRKACDVQADCRSPRVCAQGAKLPSPAPHAAFHF